MSMRSDELFQKSYVKWRGKDFVLFTYRGSAEQNMAKRTNSIAILVQYVQIGEFLKKINDSFYKNEFFEYYNQ